MLRMIGRFSSLPRYRDLKLQCALLLVKFMFHNFWYGDRLGGKHAHARVQGCAWSLRLLISTFDKISFYAVTHGG